MRVSAQSCTYIVVYIQPAFQLFVSTLLQSGIIIIVREILREYCIPRSDHLHGLHVERAKDVVIRKEYAKRGIMLPIILRQFDKLLRNTGSCTAIIVHEKQHITFTIPRQPLHQILCLSE